ncbi:hypothetical protein [Candidatus Coxiella mudrowiae]|uniref:hypothetical protein n=1 Tax=Candidatus Coxiella mudrowiae TaxID=2054173 RepID=UPI001FCF867C|nr:hypothetical protein [Candidatus Coxiella mudrowiae]
MYPSRESILAFCPQLNCTVFNTWMDQKFFFDLKTNNMPFIREDRNMDKTAIFKKVKEVVIPFSKAPDAVAHATSSS